MYSRSMTKWLQSLKINLFKLRVFLVNSELKPKNQHLSVMLKPGKRNSDNWVTWLMRFNVVNVFGCTWNPFLLLMILLRLFLKSMPISRSSMNFGNPQWLLFKKMPCWTTFPTTKIRFYPLSSKQMHSCPKFRDIWMTILTASARVSPVSISSLLMIFSKFSLRPRILLSYSLTWASVSRVSRL